MQINVNSPHKVARNAKLYLLCNKNVTLPAVLKASHDFQESQTRIDHSSRNRKPPLFAVRVKLADCCQCILDLMLEHVFSCLRQANLRPVEITAPCIIISTEHPIFCLVLPLLLMTFYLSLYCLRLLIECASQVLLYVYIAASISPSFIFHNV